MSSSRRRHSAATPAATAQGRTRRRVRGLLLAALLPLLAALAACGSTPVQTISSRGFPLADLTITHGGSALHLTVEIAATEKDREHGLMNVRHMADDQGMVFLFPRPPVMDAFWMKDTLIPLDVVFYDGKGRIVDMESMTPCTADPCTIYYPHAAYASALELNPGVLQHAGIQVGDAVAMTRRGPAKPVT